MYVSAVTPEDMTEDVRSFYDQASEGAKKFIGAVAHAPEHAARLFPYYYGIRAETLLGPKVCELLRLAIAQTTQCPVCLAGRSADAFDEGLTEEQIAAIVAPDQESFTPRELAVISFATKFGADHFAIGERDFVELRRYYGEQEVVEIGMLCAQFLGFGRLVMVLGLENPVCPLPPAAPATARV